MVQTNSKHGTFIGALDYLPPYCRRSILDKVREHGVNCEYISEIRMRLGRHTSICIGRRSILCDYITGYNDIRNTVRALCAGSVYAYQSTIKQGYIPMPRGGRAGVVGDMADTITDIAVESITSINIRIPHHVRGVSARLYDLFMKSSVGMIIYSPPAVGKTTLLRDLAIELSRGTEALKVALVDSRRELDNGCIPSECMIDTYAGYPKSRGIEIAVRTMSSDVIICDEVGYEEVEAIRHAILCSVPIIAAAHASSRSELCSREGIADLIGLGAFGYCVGISRDDMQTAFRFDIERLGGP